MADISVVGEGICTQLGEGPTWDTTTQKLLFVDTLDYSVHVLDVETKKDKSYQLDGIVGCVVPRKNLRSVILACERTLRFLDLETEQQEVVVTVDEDKPANHFNDGKCDPVGRFWAGTKGRETGAGILPPEQGSLTGQKEVIASVDKDKPGNRFNDGKCDPAGRFWAGTMGPEPKPVCVTPHQGSLYSLDSNLVVQSWFDKISISNGIAWTPDKRTFYHVDSFDNRIDAFDYDETRGTISNRRNVLIIDNSLGAADGMTIAEDGMLWVALYNGWKVAKFNPCTGEYLTHIDLPVAKVTSCCWAGANSD